MNRNRQQPNIPGLQPAQNNQRQQRADCQMEQTMQRLDITNGIAPTLGDKIIEVQQLVLALAKARREDLAQLHRLKEAQAGAEQTAASARSLAEQQAEELRNKCRQLQGDLASAQQTALEQRQRYDQECEARSVAELRAEELDNKAQQLQDALTSTEHRATAAAEAAKEQEQRCRLYEAELQRAEDGIDDIIHNSFPATEDLGPETTVAAPHHATPDAIRHGMTGGEHGVMHGVDHPTENSQQQVPPARSLEDKLVEWHNEMADKLNSIICLLKEKSPMLDIDSIEGTDKTGNVLQAKVREVYAAVPAVIASLGGEDREQLRNLVAGTTKAIERNSGRPSSGTGALTPWAAANTYVYNKNNSNLNQLIERIFGRQGLPVQVASLEQHMRRAVVTVLVILLKLQLPVV